MGYHVLHTRQSGNVPGQWQPRQMGNTDHKVYHKDSYHGNQSKVPFPYWSWDVRAKSKVLTSRYLY